MTPNQIAFIERRLDEIHEDVGEVKRLAEATNGRVRKIELWKAKIEGGVAAVGWLPPLLTALAASGFSFLLYALFLHP